MSPTDSHAVGSKSHRRGKGERGRRKKGEGRVTFSCLGSISFVSTSITSVIVCTKQVRLSKSNQGYEHGSDVETDKKPSTTRPFAFARPTSVTPYLMSYQPEYAGCALFQRLPTPPDAPRDAYYPAGVPPPQATPSGPPPNPYQHMSVGSANVSDSVRRSFEEASRGWREIVEGKRALSDLTVRQTTLAFPDTHQ